MAEGSGSMLSGMLLMILISLVLFWLPTIGPLLAGIVGGEKAGGVGAALMAALLPGILLAGLLFAFYSTLTGMPIVSAVAGLGVFVLVLLQVGPLLIGAVIGGLLA